MSKTGVSVLVGDTTAARVWLTWPEPMTPTWVTARFAAAAVAVMPV